MLPVVVRVAEVAGSDDGGLCRVRLWLSFLVLACFTLLKCLSKLKLVNV